MISESSIFNRNEIEDNKDIVQLIAYTFIFNPVKQEVFLAKRISGDYRLINTYSLGFGGHTSLFDIEETAHDFTADPILNAGIRELREELYLKNKIINLRHLGYIRELSSQTSNHLGAIFLLTTGFVGVKEKDKLRGKWVSYKDLKYTYYNMLESWSKAVLDYIYSNEKLKKELRL